MTTEGGLNIGQAAMRVVFLDKSPFSGQQKQETALLFTPSTFEGLEEPDNVVPVPSPLNGIRIKQQVQGFDNFLTDGNQRLENAFFDQTVETVDDDGNPTSTTARIVFDSLALARVKELGLVEEGETDDGEADDGETGRKISDLQRNFFTWQVTQNLFVTSDQNPPPPKFDQSPPLDNTPEWTYRVLPRPGNDINNLMLTPFMKKNPPDSASPVHWGCSMTESLAMNQPFDITYSFCLRDPAIAKDATPQIPKIKFVTQDNLEIQDLRLTSSVYLAIEFGKGSKYNYMVLFVNEISPLFFRMRGNSKNREAVIVSQFEGFNSSKLFDPNNKFFSVSIEPVIGSLIIRSNVFGDQPWIIQSSISDPIFIGQGPIQLYGGNVQAGFALRPIQYAAKGTFKTPEVSFNILETSEDSIEPEYTTKAKGVGEVEQGRSYGKKGESNPEVHMVDAELVNGRDVTTILEANADIPKDGNSVQRKIDFKVELVKTNDEGTVGNSLGGDQTITLSTKTFNSTVTLTSGDMTQGNGFIVQRGRSPYLFLLLAGVPATEGGSEQESLDVTCDVESVDLNWNATSYNEIRHSGTISFLNIRNVSGLDYRQFTNRSVYVRIYAGWVQGIGSEGLNPIFTGKTMRADVTTRAEKEVVTFQIEDYMAAMDGVKFILSPFYDGMKASLAVRDIVLQSGFPDSRILANSTAIKDANLGAQEFGLPFANPFEEPIFRFKDGSSLKEGILKIARLDFKTIYFDQNGNFHYDDVPGGLFNNKNFTVRENFWSSKSTVGALSSSKPHNQAWNLIQFSRLINDTYNVIQVLGVEKRLLARLTGATAYKGGIYDPNAEGYLGYRKHLLIAEPALGNFGALMRYLDNYRRRVTIPPLTGKFEIFGRNNLRPLDIITLDGQLLRIMNIQTTLNKSDNNFYQNIEGEWMFAAGTGKDQQPQITEKNTGAQTNNNNAGTSSTS